MSKRFYLVAALALWAAAAFAGQKIVGTKQTTIDEPFCAG
jgi:hypothetical protein